MNTIRTTISLPKDLHEELRIQSVKERKSIGEIIARKFKPDYEESQKTSIDEDLAFFREIGKQIGKFDAVKVIRDERDSH